MAWQGHGLTKVSPGPALPYPCMSCGRAIPEMGLHEGVSGVTPHRMGGLRLFSNPLDTPRLTPYAPYALRLTPYALRLTPYALRLTPYALCLTPSLALCLTPPLALRHMPPLALSLTAPLALRLTPPLALRLTPYLALRLWQCKKCMRSFQYLIISYLGPIEKSRPD
jgi:hypothetical protein